MNDVISRQVAISAICSACGKIDCDQADNCEKLHLPPASNSEFPNNSDTISRAKAIKDAESWVAVDEYEKHLQKNVIEWLKEFPSAEHGTNLAEVGADTISRAKAIEAVNSLTYPSSLVDVKRKLADLPPAQPAQPEIIRCKDCKHWIPVTERLPDNSRNVLITSKGGVSMAWYNGSYFEKGASTHHRKMKMVTAWCELPEPYKEVTT